MVNSSRQPMLIFDGDCAACTRTADFAHARLPAAVQVVAWQQIQDLEALGLTERDVTTAAYWVDARGTLFRGERAFARALIAMGGGWAILGRELELQPAAWLASRVYPVVARHRHLLPGATSACEMT